MGYPYPSSRQPASTRTPDTWIVANPRVFGLWSVRRFTFYRCRLIIYKFIGTLSDIGPSPR